MNLEQYICGYHEAGSWHDRSTLPCLKVFQDLLGGYGFALCGIFLPTPDIFQHIEPVHDFFHVGGIRQALNNRDGVLFSSLNMHHGILPDYGVRSGLLPEPALTTL